MHWRDHGPLENEIVLLAILKTGELCDVLPKSVVCTIVHKVDFWVTGANFIWKLFKDYLFSLTIHLYHSHVDLADARVVGLVAVGSDLHEGDAKFKLVFSCIERLREISVHVFQHSIDDEIWLLVEDHLLHFQESVRPDCQTNYYGQYCTNRGLKCSSAFEIEING